MRPRRGLRQERRAVAAVEFAMLAGALIALCVGTIEVGLIIWGKCALEAAAADTARCAALRAPDCLDTPSTQTYAANVVSKWMFSGVVSASDVSLNDGTVSCSASGGSFETVRITTNYFANKLPSFVAALTFRTLSEGACYPKS